MTSPAPNISVIVPVWRDDCLVQALLDATETCPVRVEWIIAAVQPGEELRDLAAKKLIQLIECATPSRGEQMNAGAAAARGNILCFHHADTELTCEHLLSLNDLLTRGEIVGGAFHRRFDDRHPWMLGWEKFVHKFDQGFGPFFGDQSIFVRKEVFRELRGFADIELMEDLEFSGRLKKAGRVCLLKPAIWSSPRRFRTLGSWKTSLFNGLMIALYYLGVSPQRLHRLYYSRKQSNKEEQGK